MERNHPPARTVKTVETVFGIVELLEELEGSTVTELADELDFAKSTISDHLATLEQIGYVIHEDGEYYLGLRFLKHGNRTRKRLEVRRAAREPLEMLAEKTGESAWLIVEEHDEAVFIDKALGEHAVQTMGELGRRTNLHTSAAGKAILAYLPPGRKERIIEEYALPARTEHTITDPDVLEEELATIRENRLAFNHEESNRGVHAVASPIIYDGGVQGTLAVAGPKSRLSEDKLRGAVAENLRKSVNLVELNLEHDQ